MTSFIDRIRGRTEPPPETGPLKALIPRGRGQVEVIDTKAVYGGAYLSSLQSGVLLSSYDNTPQQKAAAYLRAYKCGWFYKAESKISRDIALLKVSVSPEDESGDNEQQVIEPDLRTPFEQLDPIGQFLRLMERPNPSYTGRQLRQKTQIRIDMAGAAFWYLENGDFGLPSAIYGISPARMWPSLDKNGNLLGWVMDADAPSGGVPFSVNEILPFTTASAEDGDVFGVGVVEAVAAELPLTELMARHTADLMTTGGRLAGMLWPKNRTLGEDEMTDAVRSWRNVTSDPNAARRMLIFPEPMEYAAGASTPAEIGIPELATLNRDNILTAFPISPYQLGVPMPGGLNSGETRKEDRRDYWEGTIHPRVELLEDTIQIGLLSRYEELVGGSWDFDITEPNLDDATRLIEKAGAFKALVGIGFDAESVVEAVGLESIKWNGLPALLDPAQQALMAQQAAQEGDNGPSVAVGDTNRRDASQTQQQVAKGIKSRDEVTSKAEKVGTDLLTGFLAEQRDRLAKNIAATMPASKAARMKADAQWWDQQAEDEALTATLRSLYVEVGRGSLQIIADRVDKIVANASVKRILQDLLAYGGARITDINERTRDAVALQLAEGVRRGYSIPQLTDGVPAENYPGVKGALLDNGVPAFDGYRAEMIARTETALSFNRSSLTGYDHFGIAEVQAVDGDGDAECASRDGHIFAVDEALGIEDHPNGTLDWIPIIPEKSEHGAIRNLTLDVNPSFTLTPNITIHQPATKIEQASITVQPADVVVQPVQVEAPVVNVEAPIIHLPEHAAPTVNVTVPEQPTPTVTVNVPKAEPVVNVKAPTVNVEAPSVTVQAPDVVTQKVQVQMPDSFAITSLPTRVTRRKVDRNPKGAIEATTDVEEDA